MHKKTVKNPLGSGRDKKKFDPRQFEELCKIQCTEKEICAVLGMGVDTLLANLKKEYRMTFEEARQKFAQYGKASLRRLQFNLATKSPAIAIWLGKQYLGQKEPVNVDAITNNNHVMNILNSNKLESLKDEELDSIIEQNFKR